MAVEIIHQFDVFLIRLDPTVGSEIQKTRPGVIISPNEMNVLRTVIIAPLTTKGFEFPTRVATKFDDEHGFIVLDQLRAIDKSRLIKKLGKIDKGSANKILAVLREMFCE